MGAVDYFLKFDGVDGDSTSLAHKGEFEIKDWSFAVENKSTIGSATGGAGAGKASFQAFRFTINTSKGSPILFIKSASGAHIKQGVLIGRKNGERPDEFLKITLSDVLVSSYQQTGVGPGPQRTPNDVPLDAVSLRYSQVQYSIDARTLNVPAGAIGQIRFDPKTNQFIAFDAPGGIMTVGTVAGMTQRAVQEFDIANLIGLLTAPFSTAKLGLVVTQVRPPTRPPTDGAPPEGGAQLSVTAPDSAPERLASAAAAKPQKLPRYDVILYTPADGTITVEDLTRRGRLIGTIRVDPNAPMSTLEIDLLRLMQKRHLDLSTFGIRLQLRGAHVGGHTDDDDDDEHDGDDNEQNDHGDNNDDHGDENDRDDKPATQPDQSAAFTIDLVLVTA